jgi:hypothetical protein
MTWLGDFHFVRPLWLLALLAYPLLLLALRRGSAEAQTWRGAVDAHLLRHLLERDEGTRASSPHWLVAVAWLLACIALAGPAWERLPMPLFQNRAARVIALELAPSMLSQDVKPTRVERARYKIVDILRRSRDAQTALIAYSGDAFVVAPLTDDVNTVENLLEALEPSIMPIPGNDTARAIESGTRLIAQAGLHDGEIILVADSVNSGAVAAASKARAAGVRVSVLGIGTDQGAPIATVGGGFLQGCGRQHRDAKTGLSRTRRRRGGRWRPLRRLHWRCARSRRRARRSATAGAGRSHAGQRANRALPRPRAVARVAARADGGVRFPARLVDAAAARHAAAAATRRRDELGRPVVAA